MVSSSGSTLATSSAGDAYVGLISEEEAAIDRTLAMSTMDAAVMRHNG